ncbi:hypothetical protein [Halocatena halophila]|uniref:hypothetical protein n=1 Tax=Halocatena halophila TaxID=2814576 RepID=UPI002ED21ECF
MQPVELDSRSKRRHYSYVQAKVTRQAGELIDNKVKAFEPVTVSIEGVPLNRFYVPQDGITLNNDNGIINLDDAHKIMERGAITKNFDDSTLGDIVDFIYSKVSDPLGAIKSVEFTAQTDQSESIQSYSESLRGGFDVSYPGVKYVEGAANVVGNSIQDINNFFAPGHVDSFASLQFDNISPRKAMAKVEDEFGVESWVDILGTLWVGHPESRPVNSLTVDPRGHGLRVKELNITKSTVPIKRVIARGATDYRGFEFPEMDDIFSIEKIYPVAEAWVSGANDGRVMAIEEPLNIYKQKDLEEAVKGYLLRESMGNTSGNIAFNGLASQSSSILSSLSVGDTISVPSTTRTDDCSNSADGGDYIVRGVKHNFNPRLGWESIVDLGGVPDSIESKSYIYDPTDSQKYADVEAYNSGNAL